MKRIALRPLRTRRIAATFDPTARAAGEKSFRVTGAKLTTRRSLAVAGLVWLFASGVGSDLKLAT